MINKTIIEKWNNFLISKGCVCDAKGNRPCDRKERCPYDYVCESKEAKEFLNVITG